MSDYKPTTEEVKASWYWNLGVDTEDIDADVDLIAGWDTWLNSVKAEAYELAIVTLVSESAYEEARKTNPFEVIE